MLMAPGSIRCSFNHELLEPCGGKHALPTASLSSRSFRFCCAFDRTSMKRADKLYRSDDALRLILSALLSGIPYLLANCSYGAAPGMEGVHLPTNFEPAELRRLSTKDPEWR